MKTLLYIILAGIFISCGRGKDGKPKYDDTPTSGEILILADESYQPMVQVQVDTFMELYKYAKINVRYLPEEEMFRQMTSNDSVRLVIAARELNEYEKEYFNGRKIIPRTLKIAVDAVAFIVNRNNPDTNMTLSQMRDILSGRQSKWPNGDSIFIVYDRSGSANARYLKKEFLDNMNLPANSYASNSNAEVVNYVSNNSSALGVISVNWISDSDDAEAVEFRKNVNVVGISNDTTEDKDFYQPYQAYIALKNYPFTRDVMIISREGRNGLGTGFASFVAGDKGQRLIRLIGLLPATMPVRIVNVN